jgi:hypothetical protein
LDESDERSYIRALKREGTMTREWQAMVTDFRKTLDRFNVPVTEQEELITIVGSTKKDVVTP